MNPKIKWKQFGIFCLVFSIVALILTPLHLPWYGYFCLGGLMGWFWPTKWGWLEFKS